MTNRSGVVEIESREGDYRVELRDLETNARIDDAVVDAVVDGGNTGETTYKHVCKVRLPEEAEPRIDLEPGDTPRVVLRADGRTWYRHELPTRSVAN